MLNFPINEVIPKIKETLQKKQNLIIEAPAGAGKSTIVPISLLKEIWLKDKKIFVLEPRRVAARAVATQMAKLLGEKVGQTVGYQIKMESCISKDTKIVVLTEGILTRKLQNDIALEDVACVIFDEFHERSIHSDLSLALALQSQEMLRDDLKIILMSATLNSEKLQNLIPNVEIIKSKGKMYDVEEIYLDDKIQHPNKKNIITLICDTILDSLKNDMGDILVFLPGINEINKLKIILDKHIDDKILILPLHSNLTKEEQDLAINRNIKRKVILSTNLAQTSLTIEGIKVVIDSGLEKLSRYDYSNGMDYLELNFISKDSAIQRQGRAGRLSEGKCYKLWHKKRILEDETKPEILRVDLSSFLLDVKLWGVDDLTDLVLLDLPKKNIVEESNKLLHRLEMLNEDNSLSDFGKDTISLGLHPRLAFMLLKANEFGYAKEASVLASLLVEKDIFSKQFTSKDFIDRYEAIFENNSDTRLINLTRLKFVKKQAEFYFKRLEKIKEIKKYKSFDRKIISILLLFAYPDRLAKLRENTDNIYALSNKKQAVLIDAEQFSKNEYLVVINMSSHQTTSYINMACCIELKDIQKFFAKHFKEEIFVSTNDKIEFRRRVLFEDLIIEEKPTINITNEQFQQAMFDYIYKYSVYEVFEFDKKTLEFLDRINFYNNVKNDDALILYDYSNENLTKSVKSWLTPYLFEIKKFEDLKKLDLFSILSSMISWEDIQKLDNILPNSIKVPSGTNIKIDYSDSCNPILKVKIQEVFGLMETPKILNNKLPLTIHLLNPANRVIQITKDLKSFWENSYDEVRKELRGKYKKHYWPENPFNAIATNKTKRQM